MEPNDNRLSAEARHVIAQLGITAAQYLATGDRAERQRRTGLTAEELHVIAQLGIEPAAYLAMGECDVATAAPRQHAVGLASGAGVPLRRPEVPAHVATLMVDLFDPSNRR
jgi:hypothetical protein